MTAAMITIVGKMKVGDGEEEDVTIRGMADVIMMHPGSPPPRPHPGDPPGTWGGAGEPFPTPPIHLPPRPPGYPAHPIYWPPGIWGGGNEPFPTPPIAGIPGLPGYEPPKPGEPPREPPLEAKIAWTAETGWVVVYVPTGEHVTPSK